MSSADLLVTDPPYGVAYVGKTKAKLRIRNDDLGEDGMTELWRDSLSLAAAALKPGGAYYITGPPGALLYDLMGALRDAGLPLRHTLIWAKDSMVLGRSDYHYQHEPILYGWRPGSHEWSGDRRQTSLWQIPRPRRNADHPTMKPVELYERAIDNSSGPGDLVLDPFAGSGTCVIACQNMGRRARLIEYDRAYADVIIDRWERHTGMVAERDG